ncbi:hypothetical protein PRNP1_007604 [Phytophthora ramorum]
MVTRSGAGDEESKSNILELAKQVVRDIKEGDLDEIATAARLFPRCSNLLQRVFKIMVVEVLMLTAGSHRQNRKSNAIRSVDIPRDALRSGIFAGLYVNLEGIEAVKSTDSETDTSLESWIPNILASLKRTAKNKSTSETIWASIDVVLANSRWSQKENESVKYALAPILLGVFKRYEKILNSLEGLQAQKSAKYFNDDLVVAATWIMLEACAGFNEDVKSVLVNIGIWYETQRTPEVSSDTAEDEDKKNQSHADISETEIEDKSPSRTNRKDHEDMKYLQWTVEDGASKNAMEKTPCLYWIDTGYKEEVDDVTVFKMGMTEDLPRRFGEHIKTFGRKIKLHGFILLPFSDLSKAETTLLSDLSDYKTKKPPSNLKKGQLELFTIKVSAYPNVKEVFKNIAQTYHKNVHTQITNCRNDIEKQKKTHDEERKRLEMSTAEQKIPDLSKLAGEKHLLTAIHILIKAIKLSVSNA